MIRLLLLFFFLSVTSSIVRGQFNNVRKSQFQTIEQKVGITDVTIEYYRPSMKGRKVFGEMEPMAETWRTGANRNSKVTFSEKVTILGKELAAGTYAIFTRPDVKTWDVYFYTELTNWDVPEKLDESKIAAMITVTPEQLIRTVETLTMTIDDLRESSASLGIMWENTRISIPIEFHTQELMSELIDETMIRNRLDYHIAAVYLREHDMDLDRAKELMKKAIVLSEEKNWQDFHEMGKILFKMGDQGGAIKATQKGLNLAQENDIKWAVKACRESLEEYGAK